MNLVVWAVIGGGHSQTPFCPPSPCHNQSHDLFISDCLFPYVVNPHGLPLSFLMRTIDVCCVTTSSSSCSQPSGTLYWNRTSQLHFLSFLLLSAWPAHSWDPPLPSTPTLHFLTHILRGSVLPQAYLVISCLSFASSTFGISHTLLLLPRCPLL